MAQTIFLKEYDNGLTVAAEQMPWLESVAMSLHLQSGCGRDPEQHLGLCNLACEMVQRGAGRRSSREFLDALENLGVDHSASVSVAHSTYTAAMVSDKMADALPLYADLVRAPRLPEDQLEDARQVCIHEIRSVEDDFAQKTLQQLRRRHYGDPWGRSAAGELEHVKKLNIEQVRGFVQSAYGARQAILAVAGKFDWPRLEQQVNELFGAWPAQEPPPSKEVPPERGYEHLEEDTNQTHIGLAFPSLPYRDPNYFLVRAAVGVLSDGVSSRLFTEVREKRGLCYAVSAYCHSFLDRGSILCYAGTTTERAQETLNVTWREIQRMYEGIQADELDRVKARIKSALIMQQESSGSRSGSIAGDLYYWGRVRTIEELRRIIDGLTVEAINEYLAAHPPQNVTLVTLGAKPLEVPLGVC